MNNPENEADFKFYVGMLNGICARLGEETTFNGVHFYSLEACKIVMKLNDIMERDLNEDNNISK